LAGKPLFNETVRNRRGAVGCSWFHRQRVHSATMARLSSPARLPPKSVKISIRHGQVVLLDVFSAYQKDIRNFPYGTYSEENFSSLLMLIN